MILPKTEDLLFDHFVTDIVNFNSFFLFIYCQKGPNWEFFIGKFGRFPWGKKAATGSRHPAQHCQNFLQDSPLAPPTNSLPLLCNVCFAWQ